MIRIWLVGCVIVFWSDEYACVVGNVIGLLV